MRTEVEATGPKLSITEGGNEGKSKVIASCSYLEEKFQECSKAVGSKRERQKEEIRCEVLIHQRE